MVFEHPYILFLLLLIIPYIAWYIWKHRFITPEIKFPTTSVLKQAPKTPRMYLRHAPFVLRCLSVASIVMVLAQPQKRDSWKNEISEGIDIMLVLDISGSMLAEDLRPNRLEAAKSVAVEFISGRSNDNIGLVAFSGQAFTQCPLTVNHKELINLLLSLKTGMIEDGTAIGNGLATAVNRIKESPSASKAIILLTDGANNRGEIAPITAAEIAQSVGIRLYTIGVSTYGTAPYPFQTPAGIVYRDIDEDIDDSTLEQMASTTGGRYFRATDNTSLRSIYQEIDKMEKTRIQVKEYSKREELYFIFAALACCFLLVEILLKNTVLKSIP
jgi:Ca-activated chloride channel homolog